MSQFLSTYIEIVHLLLAFIRAAREGKWQLHLDCVAAMLPYMFAYDRTNYSRYLTVYWAEMIWLETTHPEAYALLNSVEFAVQRSSNSKFAQVAVDMAIEQTVNKDTKTSGGIIGFSLKPCAVERWFVTAHERAAIMHSCMGLAGMGNSRPSKQSKKDRERDEVAVVKVLETLGEMVNPCFSSYELVSLATGICAPAVVKQQLTAIDIGTFAMEDFVTTRLMEDSKNVFDPIPGNKLAGFGSLSKKVVRTVNKRAIVLKADKNLFARLAIVAQIRNLDMRNVLTYSLRPVSWALANPDGSLTKTMKSKVMHLLEENTPSLESVPAGAAVLIDGMALLQCLSSILATFGELAEKVFKQVTRSLRAGGSRVDFVTDQYPEISINGGERQRRADARSGPLRTNVTRSNQPTPKQWKRFLTSGENKASLVQFFVKEWCGADYTKNIHGTLYVSHGNSCTRIFASGEHRMHKLVSELKCDHFTIIAA